MPKGRRAVRLIFNTYYSGDAEKILAALQNNGIRFKLSRSKVTPELYYVDIDAGSADLEELRRRVERIVQENKTDTVFGVKVYSIDASR